MTERTVVLGNGDLILERHEDPILAINGKGQKFRRRKVTSYVPVETNEAPLEHVGLFPQSLPKYQRTQFTQNTDPGHVETPLEPAPSSAR